MKADPKIGSGWTRRAFVRDAALAGAGLCIACGSDQTAQLREAARRSGAGLDCSDVSDLQPAEARTRGDNAYRQHTDKDDQFCLNCLNFVAAAEASACGTCKTVRGPINPDGWCKQWTKSRG
jgi:hypothetical protein